MTCAHCPPAIEKALAAVPGVLSAQVNLASNTATIRLAGETLFRRSCTEALPVKVIAG